MAVNIEIKGNLARLLATENLIVEHKQVETAMFDVDRRVLTLPNWQRASNQVYDMLVAHEVGHALFTPYRSWNLEKEYRQVPPDYVNVVEDARIERLMKNKFAGLSRDFHAAYNELHQDDFFCVKDEDINNMNLIDKINLYFKIGAYLCIDFTEEEEQFVTEIAKSETFDDVLDIAKRVYIYTKSKTESFKAPESEQPGGEEQSTKPQSQSDDSINDCESSEQSDEHGEDGEDEPKDVESEEISDSNDEVSKTQQSFDGKSKDLIDRSSKETLYVTVPDLNLNNAVVTFDTIKAYMDEHYDEQCKMDYRRVYVKEQIDEYTYFKKSANKEVNYLVKEFEMRKSADAYARATTSRTGVLNTSKLHTYKYNEDLFKKVTTLPDGKNHGLVFYLDWSGSMQHIMMDTMKQLFQLVWFCRKSNIPYDVYAFSNDAYTLNVGDNTTPHYDMSKMLVVKEWIENDINVEGTFRMVNILSSTAKSKDNDKMMQNLWLTAVAFVRGYYDYPPRFQLSGTPLNECIIASKDIMKAFIAKHKVQKCHAILLTDGEGYAPAYNVLRKRYDEGVEYKGRRALYPSCVIRNHKNGRTYSVDYSSVEITNQLMRYVKDELPGVSFIGFRILERGAIRNFFNWYGSDSQYTSSDEMREEIRKNNSVCIKSKAFDLFFGLPQSSLDTNANLDDISDDASKREVAAAFKKMFKNKKSNKFVLQTFVEQIA